MEIKREHGDIIVHVNILFPMTINANWHDVGNGHIIESANVSTINFL